MTKVAQTTGGEMGYSYLNDPYVRLMLQVQQGDEEAFDQLVSAFRYRIVAAFFTRLQDWETAEELTQELFLRVYRNRHNYKPTARFATWLFRIAGNLTKNCRRDRQRRREICFTRCQTGGDSPEARASDETATLPVQQLEERELRSVVRAAVEELNDPQRTAMLLTHFQGMSYKEVGRAMQRTPASVKSLLSRARKNLKNRLEPYVTAG